MAISEATRLTQPTYRDAADITALVQQMSPDAPEVSLEDLQAEIADRKRTWLMVRRDPGRNNRIVVMGIITRPSRLRKAPDGRYRQAWIEDVVADESCRGQDFGPQMVQALLDVARTEMGVQYVDLTTRHGRIGAIITYLRSGFVQRAAGVYRYEL